MNKGRMGPLARRAAGQWGPKPDELAMLRKEYEESPEYIAGCELLDGLTEMLGISAEQAAEMLTSGVRPRSIDVLGRRFAKALAALEQAGKLQRPSGEYLGSEAFRMLMRELPVSAAVRVFEAEEAARQGRAAGNADAEQAVLEKLRAQRALPAPLRKSTPVSAEQDFASMSSEEFERFKQRYFSR